MDEIDRDRLQRDAAGVGPYARERERLVPMRELDGWDVADGEPDIRGWDVRTVSGREVGEVKDYLVDADAREVVMIDVDLRGTDRHAAVPIRLAEIDRDARVVRVDSSDIEGVGGALDREVTRDTAREVAPRRESGGRVRFRRAGDGLAERGATERPLEPGKVEEVVVESRPVVVEETIVRRRVLNENERGERTD